MSDVRFKICGLTSSADVAASILAGASYVGFVFFPKSPRHLELEDAVPMVNAVPAGIAKVALTVDPTDAMLDQMLDRMGIDILQLHGSESPDRVAEVSARFGLPVMKAVGVADEGDLPALDAYARVADQLLVDAKPARDAILPGGNGVAFDWRLIAGRRWPVPWMLAGGLTPENAAEAVRLTGARQLDVSSGVEAAPGIKDAAKIAAFGAAVRAI
ncbi:phosphoribosylanthranilate isomerase [Anianabacter salinae]|uniref:phosphoribosylanthranilate isomerase n=1 Tax=Anianabacter salinae TaxID=2851023 RepID=UPI00225DD4B8|nr:phosphoribosylanthranilate isomerase [Anianabacter salinae]MBV0912738.1 phosphoribosylanthranilate isomerase [Anianabacter salinae]